MNNELYLQYKAEREARIQGQIPDKEDYLQQLIEQEKLRLAAVSRKKLPKIKKEKVKKEKPKKEKKVKVKIPEEVRRAAYLETKKKYYEKTKLARKEKIKETARKYYQKNKEKIQANRKLKASQKKEKRPKLTAEEKRLRRNAYLREYRKKYPEKLKIILERNYAKNKEKMLARSREYKAKNKVKLQAYYKERAQRKKVNPTFAAMEKHYTFKVNNQVNNPFIRVMLTGKDNSSTYIGDIFYKDSKVFHNLPNLEPIQFFNRQYMGNETQELTLELWATMMNNQKI